MKNKKRKKKLAKIQKKVTKLRSIAGDAENIGFPVEILSSLERSLNLAVASESALEESAKFLLATKRNHAKAFDELKGTYKNIKKELQKLKKQAKKKPKKSD